MFLQNDGIDLQIPMLTKFKTLTLYFIQVQRSCGWGGGVQLSTFDNLRYALLMYFLKATRSIDISTYIIGPFGPLVFVV
jgi:hypothetical protein